MFWSHRSKRISLGRTWSKHRYFGRSGQNLSGLVETSRNKEVCGRAGRSVSRLVEISRNIEVCGRADRNISRFVELGRNLDVFVASVQTYLAWSNLVELGQTWSNLVKT